MNIGEMIRKYRRARGYTQKDLAHLVGVTRNTLGRWELGQYQPKAKQLILLAGALSTTEEILLWGEEEPK